MASRPAVQLDHAVACARERRHLLRRAGQVQLRARGQFEVRLRREAAGEQVGGEGANGIGSECVQLLQFSLAESAVPQAHFVVAGIGGVVTVLGAAEPEIHVVQICRRVCGVERAARRAEAGVGRRRDIPGGARVATAADAGLHHHRDVIFRAQRVRRDRVVSCGGDRILPFNAVFAGIGALAPAHKQIIRSGTAHVKNARPVLDADCVRPEFNRHRRTVFRQQTAAERNVIRRTLGTAGERDVGR